MSKNCLKKTKKYAYISLDKRKTLVQFVFQKLFSVKQASKNLKIKLSTAKSIVRRYKNTGTFYEKKKFLDQSINQMPHTEHFKEQIIHNNINQIPQKPIMEMENLYLNAPHSNYLYLMNPINQNLQMSNIHHYFSVYFWFGKNLQNQWC